MKFFKLLPLTLLVFLCGCGASNNSNIDKGAQDSFISKFKPTCVNGCETSCNQATESKQTAVCQSQCEANCECAVTEYRKSFEGQSFLRVNEIANDPVKAQDIIQSCLKQNMKEKS